MSDLIQYRAVVAVRMPEGMVPRTFQAGAVILIPSEALRHPEIQRLIRTGRLVPVPATPTEPEPLTASEVIEALKQHPDIYQEVRQHFLVESVDQRVRDAVAKTVRDALNTEGGKRKLSQVVHDHLDASQLARLQKLHGI